MLTATYSLVAITAEQEKTRGMLVRLQHYVRTTWNGFHGIDFTFLNTAFERLLQFDRYCRSRKLEVVMIPALRSMSREADALIAELDSLSDKAMNIVRSIADQLAAAFEVSLVQANQIYDAMERYCDHLFVRLEREENELIPMARRLFSIEDWFTIAAQFLAEDAGGEGKRRHSSRTARVATAAPFSSLDMH